MPKRTAECSVQTITTALKCPLGFPLLKRKSSLSNYIIVMVCVAKLVNVFNLMRI